MNINLELIVSGNPFQDFPELREIWPVAFIHLAEAGLTEIIDNIDTVDLGSVFLIKEDERVVGITGFYPYELLSKPPMHPSDRVISVGLCWHGIIPSERNKGYSSAVLPMVSEMATAKYQNAGKLVELLPVNAYGQSIKGHFDKLGFVAEGDPEKFNWADNHWQAMVMPLNQPSRSPRP